MAFSYDSGFNYTVQNTAAAAAAADDDDDDDDSVYGVTARYRY